MPTVVNAAEHHTWLPSYLVAMLNVFNDDTQWLPIQQLIDIKVVVIAHIRLIYATAAEYLAKVMAPAVSDH